MSPETIALVIGVAVAAYMAWNIGANDVANAMGTSVGARALTVKQAIIIAAVFEFGGAVLAGRSIRDRVLQGRIYGQSAEMVDPHATEAHPRLWEVVERVGRSVASDTDIGPLREMLTQAGYYGVAAPMVVEVAMAAPWLARKM